MLGAQQHPQGSLYLAYTPPQPGQVPAITRMQKLSAVQERICKAPCAWRVPPPSRGRSPLLPVCKSYQQCKKRPTKSPFARRVPPPSRGRSPLLPVCKSYQQCTNRPPHGKGVRFRVILYWLRQRVWVVVPLAEPHSGCPARLDPSRPSDLQRRLGLTSSPAARMPMYMARGMLACLGFRGFQDEARPRPWGSWGRAAKAASPPLDHPHLKPFRV